MINFTQDYWRLIFANAINKDSRIILSHNFTSLLRIRVSTGYNYFIPKYGGTLFIYRDSTILVTRRTIYLNDDFVFYFPVLGYSIKFIPQKYLSSCVCLVREYIVPIADIPAEDIRSLVQR